MTPDRDPDHAVTRAFDPDICRCPCHSLSLRGVVGHFASCCHRCGECGERIKCSRVAAHADGCRREATR